MLFPSHRDMAVYLIRGVEPRRIFAQYMGRVGGLTQGRDGNMHMGDLKLNIVAIISAMAACVPVATGAALAMKYKGTQERGVLLLRRRRHQPRRLARRVEPGGRAKAARDLHLQQQPVRLLHAATRRRCRWPTWPTAARLTISRRRRWTATTFSRCTKRPGAPWSTPARGKGPYLLECKTFRMTGHSAHDPADYVPKHLWEEWGAQGPDRAAGSPHAGARMGGAGRSGRDRGAHHGGSGRSHRLGRAEPVPGQVRRCWTTCTRAGNRCRPLISKPSAKVSGKRWSATRTSS